MQTTNNTVSGKDGCQSPRTSPPRPGLVFRVGVVGHRPKRLNLESTVELRRVIHSLLEQIRVSVTKFFKDNRDLYDGGNAQLRVVSPLAEGSDRIVADEAMKLDYQLHCPMPFHREEYENDFDPHSRHDFRQLLNKAKAKGGLACFEMDGDRKNEGQSYGATGRVVLNHSDVLIAIWDGGPPQGEGGTVDKVREAVAFGVPVIWVDSKAPHSWQILRDKAQLPESGNKTKAQPGCGASSRDLDDLVRKQIAPPGPDTGKSTASQRVGKRFEIFCQRLHLIKADIPDLREDFFAEKQRRLNLAFPWLFFRGLFTNGRPSLRGFQVESFDTGAAADELVDPASTAACTDRLLPHYRWADKLAEFYADHYRSSFVTAFIFGAGAVVLALLPFLFPETANEHSYSPKGLFPILEMVVITIILVIIAMSWGWRWHERWLDYRLVAELVRQLSFMLPLGGGKPFPRVPVHLQGYGNPAESWMYWHVRNIERQVGMPNARVDPKFLKEALDIIVDVQKKQLCFHKASHQRSERIETHLHLAGYMCFILTFFVCLIHTFNVTVVSYAFLPILAAVFPAIGAALAGIENQGEFGRVAKRSKAMEERLTVIGGKAEELKVSSKPLRSADVLVIASELGQLMVDEVLDWRVMFTDRPTVLT